VRASARASLRAAGGGRGRAALSPRAQTPDGPRRAGRAAQGAVLPAAQRDRAALPREQAAAVHGARPPCAAQRAPPRSPSTSCRGSGPRSAAGAPAHSASALALEEVYPLRMGTWSQGWPEAARARARGRRAWRWCCSSHSRRRTARWAAWPRRRRRARRAPRPTSPTGRPRAARRRHCRPRSCSGARPALRAHGSWPLRVAPTHAHMWMQGSACAARLRIGVLLGRCPGMWPAPAPAQPQTPDTPLLLSAASCPGSRPHA
jgi:hypothetical protein